MATVTTEAKAPLRQVVIYPDREDGGWVAEVPSLPGCVTQGATKEEVIVNIRDAINTWLDGAEQVGLPIPEESFEVHVCLV
jgi:predicted RNase H-like HicB family nuclease